MDALLSLLRSALGLALTRAEFASVELSLVRAQVMRWLMLALAAAVLGMLALIALSALVVLVFWERYGWLPVGMLAVVYAGAAAWLVLRVLEEVAGAPPLLEQTFFELARDREAVLAAVRAPAAAERSDEI